MKVDSGFKSISVIKESRAIKALLGIWFSVVLGCTTAEQAEQDQDLRSGEDADNFVIPDVPGDDPESVDAEPAASGQAESQAVNKIGVVMEESIAVRSGPGSVHPVVRFLVKGTPVTVVSIEDKVWAKLDDGTYTSINFIDFDPDMKELSSEGDTPQDADASDGDDDSGE